MLTLFRTLTLVARGPQSFLGAAGGMRLLARRLALGFFLGDICRTHTLFRDGCLLGIACLLIVLGLLLVVGLSCLR